MIEDVGVDVFGRFEVRVWRDVEWGASTRLESELAGPDHEHDPICISWSTSSRFGGVDGSGYVIQSPVARAFEADPDFRRRVLEVVRAGTVSRDRAMLATGAQHGFFRSHTPEAERAVAAARELLQACYGEAWETTRAARGLEPWVELTFADPLIITPDD